MSAEGGGGGHGSGWIVTYSDMVTLLMTMFIVIVTFGGKEGKGTKKYDSLLGGKSGTGATGPSSGKEADLRAVLLRFTPLGRTVVRGSENAPLYVDPANDWTDSALRALDGPELGTMADNYTLRVPLSFLFTSPDRLSSSGKHLLDLIARNVRSLPYDLQIQVTDPRHTAQATRVSHYLFQFAAFIPGRLGVALVRTAEEDDEESLRIFFIRNR
jgi:hypothetical protein